MKINEERINGVQYIPLKIISDRRGEVRHFMRSNEFGYRVGEITTVITHFGEVYFSMVYPDVVKAWHIHTRMLLNYACVVGRAFVALFDGREESPTHGHINTFTLADHGKEYARLAIPPGVWNGFRAPVGWADPVIIANCADMIHDPEEIIRRPPDSIEGFDWGPYKLGG